MICPCVLHQISAPNICCTYKKNSIRDLNRLLQIQHVNKLQCLPNLTQSVHIRCRLWPVPKQLRTTPTRRHTICHTILMSLAPAPSRLSLLAVTTLMTASPSSTKEPLSPLVKMVRPTSLLSAQDGVTALSLNLFATAWFHAIAIHQI